MDFLQLALAALASSGVVHPGGHVQSGNENGVPTKIDYRNFIENRDGAFKNTADETAWNGAGFAAQDKFKDAVNNPELDLVTGVSKLFYPMLQKRLAPMGVQGGDIGEMERVSGNKHVGEMVAASALWDILKSRGMVGDKTNVNFDVFDGAPGLKITRRW